MPSLGEIRKELLKKNKLEKETVKPKKIQPIKQPPKLKQPPKPKIETPFEGKIDWIKVAGSSDFKRAVYLALEGKSFRGSNEKLDKELNEKIGVFRDPNLSNIVNELKENFKNGLTRPSQLPK